jgi:hypothetical protein
VQQLDDVQVKNLEARDGISELKDCARRSFDCDNSKSVGFGNAADLSGPRSGLAPSRP